MKPITIISCVFLSISYSFAQSIETDSLAKANISKLDFLVGNWKGNGWMYSQDRQRHEFEQTEDIQFKLDGTAILIEGLGKSEGKVIHNAIALITYDKKEGRYSFSSYLSNGRKGDFKAELIGEKFYWYPMENMRYIIEINETGQWFEIGEYKQSDSWNKFFEMTLEKIKYN